jgi:hypothetical protein
MTHTELMALVENCENYSGDTYYRQEYTKARAALSDALLKVVQDAERMRWLDKNSTFMEGNHDAPTAAANVPVLAAVSNRIWYHATDDVTSYPLSAVADAAMQEKP